MPGIHHNVVITNRIETSYRKKLTVYAVVLLLGSYPPPPPPPIQLSQPVRRSILISLCVFLLPLCSPPTQADGGGGGVNK
jgi:hypothetical protein